MSLSWVYTFGGVLSDEVEHVVIDIIRGIPWISIRVKAVYSPILLSALLAVWHSSSICIRVSPIGSNLLLYGIRDAIAISVYWIEIICRVILGICSINVFLAITYSSVIGIEYIPHREVSVDGSVSAHSKCQRAPCGVLKVIVQAVSIGIQ